MISRAEAGVLLIVPSGGLLAVGKPSKRGRPPVASAGGEEASLSHTQAGVERQ